MKTVSIVGGSGFIGTRFSQRLSRNSQIKFQIIDKSCSQTFPEKTKIVDIRSLNGMKDALGTGDVIVNLAAEHRDDVQPSTLYDEVNVGGAINLCIAAREKKISKIIFTSSVAVYGFAPIGTDESGKIVPFNEYGRTKYEAELIFREWQAEAASERTLVIVRPTVVFGEQNRGNVFNLLKQIASGRFLMIGNGKNRKSLAYVENVAAFIEYALDLRPGVHTYNFVDKPDLSMNQLVKFVKKIIGKPEKIYFRIPFFMGYFIGQLFDLMAEISDKRFAVSSIRVKKFCANSVYETAISETGFLSPIPLSQALEKTIQYEFMEKHCDKPIFFSE
jgi:nucleoside-diphosphate-sugar epimerase